MWQAWTLTKQLGVRPSEAYAINNLCVALTGIDDLHSWHCWQFDQAITYFGISIENKLHETDKEGRPLYTLDQLLGLSDDVLKKQTHDSLKRLARKKGVSVGN